MAINNFKPFALDPNANVTSQADWEALPALLSGFTAGKASSAQVNKAIRQATFIAAALAQYTANKSGLDVLDDGDLNGFISKMGTAFGKDFQALDATLSALAGLATGANKLPYFTGNDTAAQTDLTSVGRDIIGKSTIADILTYLGFGDRLLEADGYFELPGGLLLQWGHGVAHTFSATVQFKKPFNVTPFIVLPHKITTEGRYATSANYTLTSFNLYGWSADGTATNIDSYTYFALGI
ncbi:phage tail protein [Escherichia coli]